MRRAFAALALVAMVLTACGKYGPPVRTRPAPRPGAAAAAEPATTPAAGSGAAETADEELERSQ